MILTRTKETMRNF